MEWCRRYLTIIWFSFFCLLINPPLTAEQAGFVPFVWHGDEMSWGYCEKVALLIPVHIPGDSSTFYLQLDSGCEGTFIYGDRLAPLGVDIDSGTYDMRLNWYDSNAEIGVSDLPIWWRDVARDADTSSRNIGTLGSSFLANRILVIDFPAEEFAVYSDSSQIPDAIRVNVGYVPAQVRDNMFYVSLVLGNDTLKSVLFDTGASDFTLVLPDEEWYKFTGLQGHESAVTKDSVPSWGRLIEVWRAPARHPLRFGDIVVERPLVNRIEWPTAKGPDFRLMGNALFYDDYTIVLDFINSRLGVMPSSTDKP